MAMGLPQPGAGLAGMRSANLTGPAPQSAAAAPQVQTQARPNPSPVAQAIPPQMQDQQAQLTQMAQQRMAQAPNMLQQLMSVLGPGGPANAAAANPMTLGALMQPNGQMPQAAQALGASPAAAAGPNLTPVQQAAMAVGR